MKNVLKLTSFLLILLGATFQSKAQTQINLGGSYLKGTGNNDASLWGGGAGVKFFLGDHVALGGALGFYPKKSKDISVGGVNANYSNSLTTVAATFDYLFASKEAMVQPYIGADLGASISTVKYSLSSSGSNSSQKNNKTYALLAPKLGINLGISQAFGLFGQAKYNFTFGDEDGGSIGGNSSGISSDPVAKFFTFDLGIYFRLSGAK